MNKFRLAVGVIGFIGTMFLPPWVPLLAIIVLSLRYRAWEAVVIGFMMDMLWLPTGMPWHVIPYFTIASIIVVWGFEPLRVEFLR